MSALLRIAGIAKESIVDGPGIRLTVFTQGCRHNCPGCHNPETHAFEGGSLMAVDELGEMLKRNPLLDGITLSGGEPFEQAEALTALAFQAKALGLNVMIYSGYTYEALLKGAKANPWWGELLKLADILVDGPFVLSRRSLKLRFRGSANQRVIDVKASLEANETIQLDW